ncbi:PREDICTED: major pollen allergen Ole e 10-like [Camelina sativa]|uniref:Major pollen allergen Ole e 10-like n=1 Tax=Camelina sativa TaxID=90675 RepID=A0ABM0Z7Q3_CAMSA|nr:PREDICTED: major pollen allergen Ole e 10-like [Camelina sativa]
MFSQLTIIFFLSLILCHPLHISAKTWCVSAASATDAQLQANIDWACTIGTVDCVKINPGGPCYEPNTLTSHASFVMNEYYQLHGATEEACDFNHTGQIINANPSYGRCRYS